MSVKDFTFMDNATDTPYTMKVMEGQEVTPDMMLDFVKRRNNEAVYNLESGSYMYENYNKLDKKLSGNIGNINPTRIKQLEYDTALFLGVSPDQVDADNDFLNLGDKAKLDFRVNPREKLEYLQGKYGKDSVFVMNVAGKPRMMLDTKGLDDQPRYIYMDSEGFTFSDFGDMAGDLPRVVIGTGALFAGTALMFAPEPTLTTKVGGGALLATGLATLDFGVKTFQDLAVGAYDRDMYGLGSDAQAQEGIDKQPMSEYFWDRAKNNLAEASFQGVIDLATLKAGSYLSRVEGFGPDKFAKNLMSSMERLNKDFFKEAVKIQLPEGAKRSAGGIQRSIEASEYSNAIKRLMERNRVAVEKIMQSLKTGSGGSIEEAIEITTKNIRRDYNALINKIAKNDEALKGELNKALNRALSKNGIDGNFDAKKFGLVSQNMLFSSFNSVKKIKDSKYKTVYRIADDEGVSYTAKDVYLKLRQVAKQNKLTDDDLKPVFKVLSIAMGTKIKSVKHLEELAKRTSGGKVLPKGVANLPTYLQKLLPAKLGEKVVQKPTLSLNMEQLDDIIKYYADKANYVKNSPKKSQEEILNETFSNALRNLRDSKVFKGKGQTPVAGFEGTAEALSRAKEYYNMNYLPFFNLADGNLIRKGAGFRHNNEFKVGGSVALRTILETPENIERYLKLLSPNDRNRAIGILRKKYHQQNGAMGEIEINSGAKLKYDVNILRQLYGKRDATGKLIGTGDAELKAIQASIKNINKVAESNPSLILSASERELSNLFSASSPSAMKTISERIANRMKLEAQNRRMMANKVIKSVIDDPQFVLSPHMLTEYLLQADKNTVRLFSKYMDTLPDASKDSIRASLIERLEFIAKKGTDSAEKGMDDTIFNPVDMLNILRDGSAIKENAELLLGKTTIRQIKDSAEILKFSRQTRMKDAGGRVIASAPNFFTIVFSDLVPAVTNKLYGRLATTPVLKKVFPPNVKMYDKDSPIVAERFKNSFAYMMASNDMIEPLLVDATTNASMLHFLSQEASTAGAMMRYEQEKDNAYIQQARELEAEKMRANMQAEQEMQQKMQNTPAMQSLMDIYN